MPKRHSATISVKRNRTSIERSPGRQFLVRQFSRRFAPVTIGNDAALIPINRPIDQSGTPGGLRPVGPAAHNKRRRDRKGATPRKTAGCRESDMSDKIYDVPAEWKQRGFIDAAKYKQMYERSVKDPNGFWGEQAKRVDWMKPFTKVKNTSFAPSNVSIKWFEDGTLNAAY